MAATGTVSASCDDDPLLASPSPEALLLKSYAGQLHKNLAAARPLPRVIAHSGSPPTTPVRRRGGNLNDFIQHATVVDKTPEIPTVSISDWHNGPIVPESRLRDFSPHLDRNCVPPWPCEWSSSVGQRENSLGFTLSQQEEEISRFLGILSQQSITGKSHAVPSPSKHDIDWCSQSPAPVPMADLDLAETVPSHSVDAVKSMEQASSLLDYIIDRSILGDANDKSAVLTHEEVLNKPLLSGSGKYNMNLDDEACVPDQMILQPCKFCGRCFRIDRLPVHESACNKARSSNSRRAVFESQTQRCSEITGRWWADENTPNTSIGASLVQPAQSRSRSSSATLTRSRARHETTSASGAHSTRVKASAKSSARREPTSVSRARSQTGPSEKEGRSERLVDKRRPNYETVLQEKSSKSFNKGASPKPKIDCSTPTKAQKVFGVERFPRSCGSSSQPSRALRWRSSVEEETSYRKKNADIHKCHANINSEISHSSAEAIWSRSEAVSYDEEGVSRSSTFGNSPIKDRTIKLENSKEDSSRRSLPGSSSKLEYFTPPPRHVATQDFTPSPILGQFDMAHNSTHEDKMNALSQLSDIEMLPDLERGGPRTSVLARSGSRSDCLLIQREPSHFSDDDCLDGRKEHDLNTHYDTTSMDEQCIFSESSPRRYTTFSDGHRARLDFEHQHYTREELIAQTDLLLPDPPSLPILKFDANVRETTDTISTNNSSADPLTAEEAQINHAAHSLNEYYLEDTTCEPSFCNHRSEDDGPCQFSDPDVLAAMMCDVKLLGAHVDRLISTQQRLFNSNVVEETMPGAPSSGDCRMGIAKSSFIKSVNTSSSSTEATDGDALWPEQPYDPSRYSDSSYYCDFETNASSRSIRPRAGSEDAELHSMVDSLERQSALFRARIRKCSERVAERRQEFDSTRSKLGSLERERTFFN